MNQLLGEYQNGNYNVSLYQDGTKIRENKLDFFYPSFPECMDVKITDYCDIGCPFCHENSTVYGKHGDILQVKFIDTLMPYTELAIGGGNPLSHPDILKFLNKLKEKNIIANITINQKHFENEQELIQKLIEEKLIYGLGISFTGISNNFINLIKKYPNVVLHIINGIIKQEELEKLYELDLKLLILGYKKFRRGNNYYSEKIENDKKLMYQKLPEILTKFKVVSFDNLAIEQLNVRRLLSKEKWQEFYMGDDGQYTMYIDLVKNEFAKNSTSIERFDLKDSIDEMFNIVRIK